MRQLGSNGSACTMQVVRNDGYKYKKKLKPLGLLFDQLLVEEQQPLVELDDRRFVAAVAIEVDNLEVKLALVHMHFEEWDKRLRAQGLWKAMRYLTSQLRRAVLKVD